MKPFLKVAAPVHLPVNMLQSIIGVLFGTNNRIKIQLDKQIYYTGDEVNRIILLVVMSPC